MSDKTLESAAHSFFDDYMASNADVEIICLATSDGFPAVIKSQSSMNFDIDTLAAAASTLYSVSNAVAKQILAKRFRVTFIESEQGNVAFVALEVGSRDYVLAMSAKESMNIAQLRLLINRLAKEIAVSCAA